MNKSKYCVIAVLLIGTPGVQSQTITETFGSGANMFTIDFVEIGNPGNEADNTGNPSPVGRVDYVYNLGKYEISRDMVTKANAAGGFGITLQDMTPYGGNGLNRPATGISWFEAAQFVNWLNTSKGHQAAYNFDSNGNFQLWGIGQYNYINPYRHKDAYYFLPSLNEWYKAAYGSPDGTWYDFPTGSNAAPISVTDGTTSGTAVYNQSSFGPADINNAGGFSAYGTMAQGGNVWEWTESASDGLNDLADESREMRGAAWDNGDSISLEAWYRNNSQVDPSLDYGKGGFRIAMIPEPSALSLLAVALGASAMMRRRRL